MQLVESPVAMEQTDYLSQLANIDRHLSKLYPHELQWKKQHGDTVADILDQLVYAEIHDVSTSNADINMWRNLLPRIHFAAKHHDIGKIYLGKDKTGKDISPKQIDSIVNKDGPLSNEEKEILQRHPITGAQILELAGVKDPFILALVASHHLIQGGYPDKNHEEMVYIKSQLSPKEAEFVEKASKLLELADSTHAIMGDRIYDKRRTKSEAYTELCNALIWDSYQIKIATEMCEALVEKEDRQNSSTSQGQRFGR